MQPNLDLFANTVQPTSRAALAAAEVLASQGGAESRGAVFTRREVVDFAPQRLVQEQLYSSAAVIASPREAITTAEYSDLSDMTSLKVFVSSLAGHVAAQASRLG